MITIEIYFFSSVTQEVQSAANEYTAYNSFWEIKINMAVKGKFLEKNPEIFVYFSALSLLLHLCMYMAGSRPH